MGRLNDLDYVEVQACNNGCVGGALTVVNSFTARMRINQLLGDGRLPPPDPALTAQADTYYNARFFEKDYQVIPNRFNAWIRIYTPPWKSGVDRGHHSFSLPGLDCGSPNCRALAEDIVLGKAQIFDCVFKLREELSRHAQELLLLAERKPPAMGNRTQESGDG